MKRALPRSLARARDRRRRRDQARRLTSSACCRARCRGSLAVDRYVAGGRRDRGRRRRLFLVRGRRGDEAPPAVARAPQADHLLHLHRLRAGDPDRRVLPARRRAAVLQLQLVSGSQRVRHAQRTRARRPRTTSPSRSSGTAGATCAIGSSSRRQRLLAAELPGVSIARRARRSRRARRRRRPIGHARVRPRRSPWRARGRTSTPPATLPAGSAATGFGRPARLRRSGRRRRRPPRRPVRSHDVLAAGRARRARRLAVPNRRARRTVRSSTSSSTRRSPRGCVRELWALRPKPCARSTRRWACCRHATSPRRRSPLFAGDLPLPSIAFSEYRDWPTGEPGLLTVAIRLSIPEIYRNIDRDAGRPGRRHACCSFSCMVIGGLFLVIEVVRARRRPDARPVDHRIGARAVRRHRAGAAGRLHAQDRHHGRRSARRAGRSRSTR